MIEDKNLRMAWFSIFFLMSFKPGFSVLFAHCSKMVIEVEFKRIVARGEHFLRVLKIKSVLFICALMVFTIFGFLFVD